MRNLKTKDLGPFSKIISKMEVRGEILELFQSVDGMSDEELEKLNNKLMASVSLIFIENYWKAENEVFKLFSDLMERPVGEIENMPPTEFFEILKSLIADPSFSSFFDLAAR